MKNWFTNNLWVKIVSLILAVITWFYVNEELYKERRISQEFYKSSFMQRMTTMDSNAGDAGAKENKNRGFVMEKK